MIVSRLQKQYNANIDALQSQGPATWLDTTATDVLKTKLHSAARQYDAANAINHIKNNN